MKKKKTTPIDCKNCGHPITQSQNGNWYHNWGNINSNDCLVILPEPCNCEEPEPKGDKK